MKGDAWMGYSENYFEETESTVYSTWIFPICLSMTVGRIYELSIRIFVMEFTIALSEW